MDGQSGPYSELQGSELVCSALSGYMAMNGEQDQPPLTLFGNQIQYQAGLQATIAVLLGLTFRDRNGNGCRGTNHDTG